MEPDLEPVWSRNYILLPDRTTRPCADAAEYFECWAQDRRVLLTKMGNVAVSTVFLVLDHSYGEGPPLLFECMVFKDGGGTDYERYETWDQAVAGHWETCRRLGGEWYRLYEAELARAAACAEVV